MRRPQMSEDEKQEIILEVCENKRTVSEVAKLYGRNKKTIYNLVKRHLEEGNTARRSKLSSTEKASISELLAENPSASIPELCEKLDLGVSRSTIQRYIKEQGYVCENNRARPCRVRV